MTTTDTVTATAVFEIDGWTCASAGGVDVTPEVAANETALKKALIKYFEDTFSVTGEPEVNEIAVEGDTYDSWMDAYYYDQDNEEDE